MWKQPTSSSLDMAKKQTKELNKVCGCGHKKREHEKMKRGAETIMPCLHFDKDVRGVNTAICGCKDFKEAKS